MIIESFLDYIAYLKKFYKELQMTVPPQHPEPSMYGPPGTTAGKT